MAHRKTIFIGTDSGATTSKTGGIDASGNLISHELRQSSTRAEEGPEAMLRGWMNGVEGFLSDHGFDWEDVGGVGIGLPGPHQSYGVLGPATNLPPALYGWNFFEGYRAALQQAAAREIPVICGNDGHFGGVAEAFYLQREQPGSVLLLAPGSGLGCAFVDADGRLHAGDHGEGAILCHSPIPYQSLGLPLFPCKCGRDWGCVEIYTTIAGLHHYLAHLLPKFPEHTLADSLSDTKTKVLSLRELAQKRDPLALAIFDYQACAMGIAAASAAMLYDPSHVVIAGGLMDPLATVPEFRQRYLTQLQTSMETYLWVDPEQISLVPARLGELSQAVGAALAARASVIA